MAIITSYYVSYDGPQKAVVTFTGKSDGQDPPGFSNTTLIDLSTLQPKPLLVKVWELVYDVSYGALEFSWDQASGPMAPFWIATCGWECDWIQDGGLPNLADESRTGNINITTTAFDLNSTYSARMVLIKQFTDPLKA